MAGASTGGGGVGNQQVIIRLQPGVLYAVSALTQDGGVLPGSTLVSMRITDGVQNIDNSIRELATGYITRDTPVSWQGIHSVRSQQLLFVYITSSALPVIQVFEHRLTVQNIGDIGRYLQSVNTPQQPR